MSRLPLVTVVIPNYNYGKYLDYALNSLLQQTYPNFEVYFRDNQSTDDSYKIALEYREKFKARGVYFSVCDNKRNVGSDMNTDLASRDGEGEFLYVLASDDAIKPEFLERVIGVFEKNPNVDTVITNREEIDEDGNIKEIMPFYNTNCIVPKEEQAAVYMMAGIAIPAQRMIRFRALDSTKQFIRKWNVAGDWYVNFRAAMSGDVAYLKDALVQYRVHTGNETSESEINLLGIFEHYQLLDAFKSMSLAYGMTKPAARYDEAVRKLGAMCPRYALKMLKCKLPDVARRYLLLAPVFNPDIIGEEMYQELMRIVDSDKKEALICDFEQRYQLERKVSYNPPEQYTEINEYGDIV